VEKIRGINGLEIGVGGSPVKGDCDGSDEKEGRGQ